MSKAKPIIDVIIPVYKGLEETKACIDSVLQADQQCTRCNLVIINDCSPEPEIYSYLDTLKGVDGITVLENSTNLGFVQTVNRGMALNPGHDVVLLNSDTLVNGNWIDRLYQTYESDRKIGTITPFSNNATICSFPNTCVDNELALGLSHAAIDVAFAYCGQGVTVDIPSGVGFCMFISRHTLNKVGLFDADTFGKGYGEENDFCVRVKRAGLRNVLCDNLFVYHAGAVSFGATQNDRLAKAMQILDDRYPTYHSEVHQYIQADPTREIRLATFFYLLASDNRPKHLHIGHGIGGGVQHHINSLIELNQHKVLSLELQGCEGGGIALSFKALGLTKTLRFLLPEQQQPLLTLLKYLRLSRVHIHHLMHIPEQLHSLAEQLDVELFVTLHDYYFINGNPTLTNKLGRYVGELSKAERDHACVGARPLPNGQSLDRWQAHYRHLLQQADLLIAPSNDCRDHFLREYPELEIFVTPHEDHEPFSLPEPISAPDKIRKVLCLGAISQEKGADIIEQCGRTLYQIKQSDVEIHLLGYAYRPLKHVITHGPYDNAELLERIGKINPDIIWLPAQWPETYSYTLSAALKTGKPIATTGIGAPAERLAGYPLGYTLPWEWSGEQWANYFCNFSQMCTDASTSTAATNTTAYCRDFYSTNYLLSIKPPQSHQESVALFDADLLKEIPTVSGTPQGLRYRILRALYRLYFSRYMHPVTKVLPVSFLRKIKRLLSNKPLHDIVAE